MGVWCGHCQRDKAMNGTAVEPLIESDYCGIISRVLAFDEDDPNYPDEWCYGDDGKPQCTAFLSVDAPVPVFVDPAQIDLLGGQP